ncbi:MAG TPA: hypothetical protein VI653_18595 [Steroidobacteraceae bacterium]
MSHLVGSRVCQPCWRIGLYGCDDCIGCGRENPIYLKHEKLCVACYKERISAHALRRYVEQYTCLFSFNKQLFDRLIAEVDWKQVPERDNRRLRSFGKFLQRHEITSPQCLLDLGHLCAARDELEPYQAYRVRRAMLAPIARAPRRLQPLLQSFANWLESRQISRMRPGIISRHWPSFGSGATSARSISPTKSTQPSSPRIYSGCIGDGSVGAAAAPHTVRAS